jgi:uncharacterized protein (DUF1330 family)
MTASAIAQLKMRDRAAYDRYQARRSRHHHGPKPKTNGYGTPYG